MHLDGERVYLASRWPKESWNARIERTLTTAEHPGTAVQWGEQCFEIIDVQTLANGGVEYTLEPWLEHHTIRTLTAYDAASETARAADRRMMATREKQRHTVNALALLTGHLPGAVQQHLADELNVSAARISMVSIVGELVVFCLIVLSLVQSIFNHTVPSMWLLVLGPLAGLDAFVRFMTVFAQGRPRGSIFGLVAYSIYYLLAPNRSRLVPPLKVEKGFTVRIGETPDELKLHDYFLMREPLITLLTVDEQRRVAERVSYDYTRLSARVAFCILFVALAGVVSLLMKLADTRSFITFLSLLITAYVCGEQVHRLLILRSAPAPSVFRYLVRPFVRGLL
jgi:hypothetical protein